MDQRLELSHPVPADFSPRHDLTVTVREIYALIRDTARDPSMIYVGQVPVLPA